MKFINTILTLLVFSPALFAHVGDHPSIHDTAAGITARLCEELSVDDLQALEVDDLNRFLTDEERRIFGTEHVSFSVNVPVRLYIFHQETLRERTPWLSERGFERTEWSATVDDEKFDIWEKDFDAGWIGLGVNSYEGGGEHYFVIVEPRSDTPSLEIKDMYPGQLKVSQAGKDVEPYVDHDDLIGELPDALSGKMLIRTRRDQRDDADILNYYQFTSHVSKSDPDQIVLTWSDDPKTTQTIQWRTDAKVKKGYVKYIRKSDLNRFDPRSPMKVKAVSRILETPNIANDLINFRHSVTLRKLDAGTTYAYAVGDGSRKGWTELREFTTAPAGVEPFSFIYMGDAQNGLDRWGSLIHGAFRQRPDAAFYIMAGDLVDRGNERDDWDSLFHNSSDIYDRRQLVPAIGNHENQNGHPTLYLELFELFGNGPENIEPERAYSFEYSNALFVILDTTLDPADQAGWLEQQLKNSKATWKFVVYHHPAYSSTPDRDNPEVRKHWLPLFDKYHVDMALQGHDHAYLRTYPMKDGQQVETAEDGTVYIVSVSGTKMYEQTDQDYIEFGMTNVATYQVLDIQISGDRLLYRSYDIDGKLKDELEIVK